MRTLVDLRTEQVESLDKVADGEGISRAEAIRRAVEQYLQIKSAPRKSAFGLLKGCEIDGLRLQRESRQDR